MIKVWGGTAARSGFKEDIRAGGWGDRGLPAQLKCEMFRQLPVQSRACSRRSALAAGLGAGGGCFGSGQGPQTAVLRQTG